VDFFGFGLPDVKKEVMSMHHSHDETQRLIPQVGDSMVTNLRRPIFTLLEDTGPGVHDTTVAACDQYLYQQQIGMVSKSLVAQCTGPSVSLLSRFGRIAHLNLLGAFCVAVSVMRTVYAHANPGVL